MARSPGHLTVAQFDLLSWVADGCPDGVYEGTAYRVSARALHNRGLISVSGRGPTWTAKITAQGAARLKEEQRRIDAERERERREQEAQAEKERERLRFRDHAVEVLEAVVAAGGRLDLGSKLSAHDLARIEAFLAREKLLPENQRLGHEPTRMDPDLGVTAYLEPDFAALTPLRELKVPRQLRAPHPAVAAFQKKCAYVSKTQLPRAARYLQGIVSAATQLDWTVLSKTPTTVSSGRGQLRADLTIKLPSGDVEVIVRELDHRGRTGLAFTTTTDYYPRIERTTANKNFSASGRLEVTLTRGWEQRPVLSQRDTAGVPLEDQLPLLFRDLEATEAEAAWARKEETRRAEIRRERWEEVKKEAFAKVAYERNAERLRDELQRRQAAAEMRQYAAEMIAHHSTSGATEGQSAREWADWIQQYAQRIDPLNGPLRVTQVSSCTYDELEPHMNGWSAYGPHRQYPGPWSFSRPRTG